MLVSGVFPLRDHSIPTFKPISVALLIVTVQMRSIYVPSISVSVLGGLVVITTPGVGTTVMEWLEDYIILTFI